MLQTNTAYSPTLIQEAIKVFDLAQEVEAKWAVSDNAQRRELLNSILLKPSPSRTSLVMTKRKPFDILAEGPLLRESRGDRRWTFLNDSLTHPLLRSLLTQTLEFTAGMFEALSGEAQSCY